MRKCILATSLALLGLFITLPGICAEPAAGANPVEPPIVKQTVRSGKRIALVIGNARYTPTPLASPLNDAHILAATLRRIGFEVQEKNNLNSRSLKQAITTFGKSIEGSEVALFYFAGHGLQIKGKNYLIPVNEKISSDKDVRAKGVAADLLFDKIRRAGSGIVVLDASREKPPAGIFKSVNRGLAPMEAPPGTIIAFAASPGKSSAEGTGSTGIYTSTLVQALDTPGLTVGDAFRQVRTQVATETAQSQVPWESDTLPQDLFLVPPFDPTPPGSKTEVGSEPINTKTTVPAPLRGFADTLTGMEFVPVPGGCFKMGDTFKAGFDWERPVHTVCVSDFSIGKYEVTQKQWNQIVGSLPAYFSQCGTDCPVERVSWNDAQHFVRELNKETGGDYRLPTEAEWEYAARSGGHDELFSGANSADAVAWHSLNSEGTTHKVGTKQPNGLGIFDMSGNVWEWVQDWYGPYGTERQVNPTGPATGINRVFRGGAWSQGPMNARTTIRYYNTPEAQIDFLGFRLAAPAKR